MGDGPDYFNENNDDDDYDDEDYFPFDYNSDVDDDGKTDSNKDDKKISSFRSTRCNDFSPQ